MNSQAPMALRRIRVIGNAKYDGGRVHRAAMIQAVRDDAKAIAGSAFAAGVFVTLMIGAVLGVWK